ncbi:hypothetical protein ACH5RR_011371 [Cinchona calisaya]|uniref:Thioredoxin-like protein HCF164, chloroplastic n=1 Tax=Cinchona calisaya TaxID=153742 RepID=A0ABD3A4P1_9GENT
MARVTSNPLGLHHGLLPYSSSSHQIPNFFKPFIQHHQIKYPRYQKTIVSCQTTPNPPTESSSSATPENVVVEPVQGNDGKVEVGFPEYPTKSVNKQIAVVSVLAAVGLFLSSRMDFGVSLKDLSAMALPYEEALSNGKPTVVEFYADWCEVCRELAPDVYKVEQQYKDRVNFVMLNVDNTKWEQELDEFGVEGIPHFAFLDNNGNEEGNVVGRLPRRYLLENVDALARGEASMPHSRVVGLYSSAESRKVHQVIDPRSHS